jgi:bacillopeptidase F
VKTAFLRASSLLTSGQDYTVTIAATGTSPITDFGGSTVDQTTKDFRGGLIQQAEGPASTSTWRLAKTLSAYGGSFVIDHTAGATASYGFRGSSIIWYTSIGPSYGIADLYVDGVLRATVNSYSPTTHYRAAFTVVGLGSASHTLTIRVRGARGSSHGTGTDVAVDAFKTGRTLVTSPTLTYTWGTVKVSAASGGVYIQSNEARSTTSFTFRSTSVEWDTVVGPAMGRASVYVDGVLKATFDNYSSTYHYGVARIFSGLSDSVHTLKILVLGTHRSTSTGSWIVIDRWVVT